jgi:putative oxidoreductase
MAKNLALLIARLIPGIVFILSGLGKLEHIPKIITYFTGLGIPFPSFQAPFVGFCEFSFGIFLVLGIMTRLSCIPLTAIMVVAIATAKSWSSVTEFLGMEEVLFIALLFVVMTHGPGLFSLDYLRDETIPHKLPSVYSRKPLAPHV